MTLATATRIPDSLNSGDTFNVELSYSDFSAVDGWSISLVLINSTASETIDSTPNGSAHLLNETAANTANWSAGLYKYKVFATNGTDRHQVEFGRIDVLPDIAKLDNYDSRSHVKKVLEALEDLILGKASDDQQSLTIAGKSLSRYTPDELIKWQMHYKDLYRAELDAERVANGGKRKGVIRTRFV